MKSLSIILMAALPLLSTAQAKEKMIPSKVKDAFQKEFPGCKASWKAEPAGFEAEFRLHGTEASANYDKSGNRKEIELEISPTALPKAALAYLKSNYPGQKISEAAKITDDKSTVTYEAEVKNGKKTQDILFDASGNLIK